jgi:hypothetical protein
LVRWIFSEPISRALLKLVTHPPFRSLRT